MFKAKSPLIIATALVLLLYGGCTASKTDRGYLIRHESAWEVNRTPWIGCPPDSNCNGNEPGSFFDCLKKDNSDGKGYKKFRRHCGVTPNCSAKNPCCKTLGCGMWVDPSEPMTAGSPARACGLTPFCSPMKPCGLTPYCGKPSAMSPNTLMLGNTGMMSGGFIPNPILPTPMPASTPTLAPSSVPSPTPSKVPTVAGPGGMRIGAVPNRLPPSNPISGSLISMGIVPGVSTLTTGGLVVANGVVTPAGVMTPNGVLLPNGTLQSQGVIRACVQHTNCTAVHPCGLTAGCGIIVPVTAVSNNAVMLASALSTPGIAGNVLPAYGTVPGYANGNVLSAYGTAPGYVNGNTMSAGGIPTDRMGTGMLVNPITGQPVSGLSMNGTTQLGYPPIGYTPTGYSPGYPRPVSATIAEEEEEEEEKEVTSPAPPQSKMPAPRFHPVPSKPAFQRSEGLPVKRTISGKVLTRESLNAAMEQAYLEGIADAMEDVQEEIDTQNRELAKAELQAKILRQARQVQAQLDTRQEAKRKLQEATSRQQEILQAQYRQTQLQQDQLQQVAQRQGSLQQTQLQQAQFQQAVGVPKNKVSLASTLGLSPPNKGPYVGHPSTMQPLVPQPPNAGENLLASTKTAGTGFRSMVSNTVSPLTEFLGIGQQKPQVPPQYCYPVQCPPTMGTLQIPRTQPIPIARMEAAPPVRVLSQRKAAPCPPCPPDERDPTAPVAKMSNIDSMDSDLTPPRPTTTAQRPKKVIEVDDDDSEPNMIQSANFVVRGS